MESAEPLEAVRDGAPDAEWTPPLLGRRDRILSLAGVLAALSLAGLDQTIVATAGPAIQQDLGIPAAMYAWITTAYLVASTVMLPIYGKLSDLLGRKPVLVAGVLLFLTGSLLAGLAPGTFTLIGARVVQGLGAASLFTSTLAVIADLFPPGERGKYMGLIGGVMGITSVIGPLVGGIITDTLGWHWVFFVNLPIGLVALAFIVRTMPRLGERRPGVRIDFAGAIWLIVGVVPLLVALSLGGGESGPAAGRPAWFSAPVLALFCAAAIGTAAFLVTETRAPEPILDLRLFRDPAIGLPMAASFTMGIVFLFSLVFLPLFLINVTGVSATRAGLTMIPLTLGIVAGSIGAGQLASRLGRARTVLLASLVLLMVAFAIMARTLTPASTLADVSWKMVLVGLGIGPSLPLYTLIVQNAARARDLGVVSAGATFSRAVGQVVGITVFGSIFAVSLAGSLGARAQPILAELQEPVRAAVLEAAPALAPGAAAADLAFDAASVRARVHLALEDAATDAEGRAAFAAVDRLAAGFADSLARALALLYRVGIVVLLAGFLLTLLIPERPARPTDAPQPSGPGLQAQS